MTGSRKSKTKNYTTPIRTVVTRSQSARLIEATKKPNYTKRRMMEMIEKKKKRAAKRTKTVLPNAPLPTSNMTPAQLEVLELIKKKKLKEKPSKVSVEKQVDDATVRKSVKATDESLNKGVSTIFPTLSPRTSTGQVQSKRPRGDSDADDENFVSLIPNSVKYKKLQRKHSVKANDDESEGDDEDDVSPLPMPRITYKKMQRRDLIKKKKSPVHMDNNYMRLNRYMKTTPHMHSIKASIKSAKSLSKSSVKEKSPKSPKSPKGSKSPKKKQRKRLPVRIVNEILTPDSDLSDDVINKCLELLKQQFPDLNGFIDPSVVVSNDYHNFDLLYSNTPFIQILYLPKAQHWVSLTNIDADSHNEVRLFDSYYHLRSYNDKTFLNQLSKLLSSNRKINEVQVVQIVIESVQQQRKANTCGLFAVAFAYDLCIGKNPSRQHYDENQMREHLYNCIQNNELMEFPKKRTKICKRNVLSEIVKNF